MDFSRREILKNSGIAAGACILGMKGEWSMASQESRVTFLQTDDRKRGIQTLFKALKPKSIKGKNVLIKPNFNTADPTPGSTHNDALVAIVEEVWKLGAKSVSVGDRSFPPTLEVMEKKGILPLLEKLQVQVTDFDDLKEKDWVEFKPKDTHWPGGFRIARPVLESEYLISTGCLKTHQYGGIFTLALKLHVGVVPTSRQGFEYMRQLHGSPHQRKLIAEINEPFKPSLVIMDGIEAFVDGGPATGKRVQGNVFWASSDRVAVDAVGVALLKHLGGNDQIMNRKIFEQEQIARAVELGLGASSPSEIDLVAVDTKSREYCKRVEEVLRRG
jgi:uncharacterized protein (DUF362 family)